MSKHGPRKIKVPVRTGVESGSSQTTSDLDPRPDPLDKGSFASRGSTTADPLADEAVGLKDKAIEKGRTWPDTITDMLSGVTQIKANRLFTFLVMAWIVLEVWLFIQDNGASRLDDWQGFRWFMTKFFFSTAFFIIVTLIFKITIIFERKSIKRKDIKE